MVRKNLTVMKIPHAYSHKNHVLAFLGFVQVDCNPRAYDII